MFGIISNLHGQFSLFVAQYGPENLKSTFSENVEDSCVCLDPPALTQSTLMAWKPWLRRARSGLKKIDCSWEHIHINQIDTIFMRLATF